MKRCTKCREVQPQTSFYRSAPHKGGVHSVCKTCMGARQRAYNATRKAKMSANLNLWLATPRGKILAALGGIRLRAKRGKYSPCTTPYAEIAKFPVDRCTICGALTSELKRGLNLDHCHTTGKFRGWICSQCNTALGLFRESTDILRRATEYVERGEA